MARCCSVGWWVAPGQVRRHDLKGTHTEPAPGEFLDMIVREPRHTSKLPSAAMCRSRGLKAGRGKHHGGRGCATTTCIFNDQLAPASCEKRICVRSPHMLHRCPAAIRSCAASAIVDNVHMQQARANTDQVTRSAGLASIEQLFGRPLLPACWTSPRLPLNMRRMWLWYAGPNPSLAPPWS